jgi:hypothetical protein
MNRMLRACAGLALASCLGACSTVQGDFHQKLQIDALDAQDRPVAGMQCQVGTGTSAIHVVTPAADVRIRRAMQSLVIECHRDSLVATATVRSRRERLEEALLPFGSAGVFIDHMSGALYAYPTSLHLRVGQHVVLEHGGEAAVVKAETLAPAALTPPTAAPVASAAKATAPARTILVASAQRKPDRAAARPPRKSSSATPAAAASGSGAGGTVPRASMPPAIATVRSAPVNW